MDRYRALGAADVIAKPFDPLSLSARVQEIRYQAHGARQAA
jgi:DNA-binding response OmpR family regulator